MKYLLVFSLFLTGCTTLNVNYVKKCHMEGEKEVCEIEESPFMRDGRDIR